MDADPAIEVTRLAKAYGELRAVDGLDLRVERGQCVALLGPNGAGKTTTTEILEGYRDRDAGDVHVLGVDPARADRRWRTRIGIVLQQVGDLNELTVRESLAHFAGYYPNPRPVDEVLEQVGLTAKASSPPLKLGRPTGPRPSGPRPDCPRPTRPRGVASGRTPTPASR